MADVNQEINQENSRRVSETTELVDETGRRLNQAARRGISETLDRAEAAQRTFSQTAQEIVDSISRSYQMMFSFQEARRMSEAYIEMNERMVKESLEFNRRFAELWFEGVRKLWQAADEGQRDAKHGA